MPEEPRLAPDVEVLKSDATKYLAVATAITTAEEYNSSADTLKAGKAFVERVESAFQPSIDSINESLKSIKALRDSIITPVKDHRRLIETARDTYEQHQAAEHARRNAEMLELARQTEQASQEALSAMGLDDMAAVTFMPPPLPPLVTKSQGISDRKQWSAEIFDAEAFDKAYCEGKAPKGSMVPNQPFLNSLARAAKTTLSIPGVRAVFRKITSVRA